MGKGNPWREVIHIREGVGSRGGLYWDLLLECGHLTFRSRPAFDAARFAGLCLAKDTDALLAHYGAPKKCRCWHCGEGGADPLSQAAILAHIKLREKMDQ